MALFTDGPVSAMEDLTARDSQLLNVANIESIDVTQKLALAQDEVALELTTLLSRLTYANQLFWTAPQPGLGNVVVTPALKLWHTLRTLELVYGDAYNSQLNDRYAGKRDQFHQLALSAYDKLIDIGIGIASIPVPRAATPIVTPTPQLGMALPDGTYFVSMSWISAGGDEGAPSAAPATAASSQGTLLVQPVQAPPVATAWNVYIGVDPGSLSLQNQSPIPAGQTWLQPPQLNTTGRAPGPGQAPSFVKPVPRFIQRG